MPGTTDFPTAIDEFPEIGPNTAENAPGKEHDVVHQNVHAAVLALQAKVGIDDSVDADSLDYRVTQLEGRGSISPALQFTADAEETDEYPFSGTLRWNHATQADATFLYVNDETADGVAMPAYWGVLAAGGTVFLQDRLAEGAWQIWEVTTLEFPEGFLKAEVVLLAHGDSIAHDASLLVTFASAPAEESAGVTGPGSSIPYALAKFGDDTGGSVQSTTIVVSNNAEMSGHRTLVETVSGDEYTFVADDTGKTKEFDHGSAITVMIPETLPKGWQCAVVAVGSGQVGFVMGTGGTLRNRQSHAALAAAPWAQGTLYVRANVDDVSAECVLAGDTA